MTDIRIGKISRLTLRNGQGLILTGQIYRVVLKSSTVSLTYVTAGQIVRVVLSTNDGLLGVGGLYRHVLRSTHIATSGIWRVVLRTPHNPHKGQMILGAL